MKFLFWNTSRKNLSAVVARIATERGSDMVILAEATDHAFDYLAALNSSGREAQFSLAPSFVPNGSRVTVFSRLPSREMAPAVTDTTCSVYHVEPAGRRSFVLACVHLSSQLHMDYDDRSALAGRTSRLVLEAEKAAGHSRTIVIGDFNMNPFEAGMVSSEGFHGILDRRVAKSQGRTVQGEHRLFFYNPMWRFMNDERQGSCGTHFYRKSKPVCHFWNTFDQVLLRPDLLPFFDHSCLTLVESFGGKTLLDSRGQPNKVKYSDHLPIHLNLNL
jgi:hypothetical protein